MTKTLDRTKDIFRYNAFRKRNISKKIKTTNKNQK